MSKTQSRTRGKSARRFYSLYPYRGELVSSPVTTFRAALRIAEDKRGAVFEYGGGVVPYAVPSATLPKLAASAPGLVQATLREALPGRVWRISRRTGTPVRVD